MRLENLLAGHAAERDLLARERACGTATVVLEDAVIVISKLGVVI